MTNLSAGLLMFDDAEGPLAVLLVHPGGPFFRNKDDGFWSLPKGLPVPDEDLQAAAIREFQEETGLVAPPPYFDLGEVRQKGGKRVHAWACRGKLPQDFVLQCNTFEMLWPPRSGRMQTFPEVDQAKMFLATHAKVKINAAQVVLVERLEALLTGSGPLTAGAKHDG